MSTQVSHQGEGSCLRTSSGTAPPSNDSGEACSARTFRGDYGCSPGEYLRRLLVEIACQRLAMTDVPLAEIALAAGFSDQSHFTKTFRRYNGMTPGEYRRRLQLR